MSNVIHFNTQESKHKQAMLEIIDQIREGIEAGEITEFVAAGLDPSGDVETYAVVMDMMAAVAMFAVGQYIMMSSGQDYIN